MIRSFFYNLYIAALRKFLPNIDTLLDEAHTVLIKFDNHVTKLDSRVENRIAFAQEIAAQHHATMSSLADKTAAERREAARAADIRNRIADVLSL